MKARRQDKILELINQKDISNQKELLNYLAEAGFKTTQSTVSRDIKELKLIKVLSEEGIPVFKINAYPAEIESEESLTAAYVNRLESIFKETVIEISSNEFMIVIKTLPGMAQAAAHAIDTLKLEEILGTIAGDDTIFVAVRSGADLGYLLNRFRSLIEKE